MTITHNFVTVCYTFVCTVTSVTVFRQSTHITIAIDSEYTWLDILAVQKC